MLKLTNSVFEEIKEGQRAYLRLVDRLALINQGQGGEFRFNKNGVIRSRDRVCVPNVPELEESIFEEGNQSGLSIHPDDTNMYQDLKRSFGGLG